MRRTLVWSAFAALAVVVGVIIYVFSPAQSDLEGPAFVGGDAQRGRELIQQYGCGSCHTIPGVAGADATVGPPLDRWAERVYIAGTLPNEPGALVRWIIDPDSVEPGTAMPDLGVTPSEAQDIAAYLFTLD